MYIKIKNILLQHEISSFYLTAIVWSWTLWFLMDILLSFPDFQSNTPVPIQIIENPIKIYLFFAIFIFLFANKGPAISAFIFAYTSHGRKGIKYWIKKIFYWRIGIKWYIGLFLIIASIKYSIPITVSLLNLGEVTTFESLSIILLFFLFLEELIPSGGQEEIGWRFIQLRLQEKYSFTTSTLINGFMNWVWHLPLYLFFLDWSGMNGNELWFFLLYEIAIQFIFSYFTNATKSVLPAILMHALFNTLGSYYYILKPSVNVTALELYIPFLFVSYSIVFILFIFNGRKWSTNGLMTFNPEESASDILSIDLAIN